MMQTAIRPAAVAGMFYPGDAGELAREVAQLLAQAPAAPPASGWPKALIVPHAGYIYSGPVAARAYALLAPARGRVKRVVLLGPAHRVAVRGLALPAAAAFDTPLGRMPVDESAVQVLKRLPQVLESAQAHAQEHALEVQLPFLQQVLGNVSLVPLVVGMATPQEVAEVLELLWGGEETLILVSSDLSHYHPYDEAREIDGATVRAVLDFDAGLSHEQACGATPIAGLMLAAQRRGLVPELLDARNSGDTAGGRAQVVGYASFAFHDSKPGFTRDQGRTLIELARASLAAAFKNAPPPAADAGWLRQRHATFVTLMLDGELRGCIGSLEARRALGEDVAANVRAAAFEDPRFPHLAAHELDRVEIEVAVLSAPRSVEFADEAELLARLVPGEDGVILEHEGRHATFLPQVWESLPDPARFIAQLRRKAGIPDAVRIARCRVQRYRVAKWREADFAKA